MAKKDKRKCSISHLNDNRYLLSGTPDQDAIVDLVGKQDHPYILISVEGGNIRDLSGSVITIPGGYLVFKRLFEVNKRPAIYLTRDIAQSLLTAAKDKVEVTNDRLLMCGHEFTFAIGRRGFEPVGYVSLGEGKKLLHMPCREQAQESASQPPVSSADEPAPPPSLPESATATPPIHVPEDISTEPAATTAPEPKPAEAPNKILTIISAIADDERNLTLIKDIAYTAYSIIATVKKSGAASKEQVAACVVAALAAPETRSALRRIGSDVFRRFKELNTEAGNVVEVSSGYRITPDNEVILDEYPDVDMIMAIQAWMKSEIVKAHINFDRSLGFPEGLLLEGEEDYGYVIKNTHRLSDQNTGNQSIYTFFER
jgi:hypothetical protein